MKKLLYITTNIHNSGGVASVLSVKLNYLVSTTRFDIHVLNTNGHFKERFFEFDERIKFYTIGQSSLSLTNIGAYRRELRSKVKEISPDIIVNTDNGLKGSILPYLLPSNNKLVYERHVSKNRPFNGFQERFKFKLANVVVAFSINRYKRFVVLNEIHARQWDFKQTVVIANPVVMNKNVDANLDACKVISIGRFSIEKRYDRLLDIWARLVTQHPKWKLEIYGAGAKKKYKEQIQKLGIEDSVSLVEPVKKIAQIYKNATLYFSTSQSESFGLSMAEAMSYGIPVVAFITDGARSLIKDGENGFLIPQDNASQFITRANELMKDNTLHKKFSAEARAHLSSFIPEKIMKKWIALFDEI